MSNAQIRKRVMHSHCMPSCLFSFSFTSTSATASSSSYSCLPSRSCIQRFIGCYKYIIRDKYVPSSFQSVCRSGPIALFPFLSLPFSSLPFPPSASHTLLCIPSQSSKKWLAIKAFSALLHICWVLAEFSFCLVLPRILPCQLPWVWSCIPLLPLHPHSRWNALVDWHWMLRLIGLIYYPSRELRQLDLLPWTTRIGCTCSIDERSMLLLQLSKLVANARNHLQVPIIAACYNKVLQSKHINYKNDKFSDQGRGK